MKDCICVCNHWHEEHDAAGCASPRCECDEFSFYGPANEPDMIADRGGEHREDCLCALCCHRLLSPEVPWIIREHLATHKNRPLRLLIRSYRRDADTLERLCEHTEALEYRRIAAELERHWAARNKEAA